MNTRNLAGVALALMGLLIGLAWLFSDDLKLGDSGASSNDRDSIRLLLDRIRPLRLELSITMKEIQATSPSISPEMKRQLDERFLSAEQEWLDAQEAIQLNDERRALISLKRSLDGFEDWCARLARSPSLANLRRDAADLAIRAERLSRVLADTERAHSTRGIPRSASVGLDVSLAKVRLLMAEVPAEPSCPYLIETTALRADLARARSEVERIEQALLETNGVLQLGRDVDALAASVRRQRATAVDFGVEEAAPDIFRRADALLAKADEMRRSGELTNATDAYEESRSLYTESIRAASRLSEDVERAEERLAAALRQLSGSGDCDEPSDWRARQRCRVARAALSRGRIAITEGRSRAALDEFRGGEEALSVGQAGTTPSAPPMIAPPTGPEAETAPARDAEVPQLRTTDDANDPWRAVARTVLAEYESAIEARDMTRLESIWVFDSRDPLREIWRSRFERHEVIELQLSISTVGAPMDDGLEVEFEQRERLDGRGITWLIEVRIQEANDGWRIVDYRRSIKRHVDAADDPIS